MGRSASVAPTTAIVGAGLPVVFSVFTEGLPAPTKLLGFAFAFVGIGLVSRSPTAAGSSGRFTGGLDTRAILLGCLSGVGFAGWFIAMGQVEAGKVFTPLIIARLLTFVTGLVLILLYRQPLPSLTASPLALLTGVLDAGGNLFYILSKEFTRLDIAAVLSSLGPAVTVLLAGVILKEPVSRLQGVGVVVCLIAIALITV
jgi:drug/metabolite transporter (DMT)-like permease